MSASNARVLSSRSPDNTVGICVFRHTGVLEERFIVKLCQPRRFPDLNSTRSAAQGIARKRGFGIP